MCLSFEGYVSCQADVDVPTLVYEAKTWWADEEMPSETGHQAEVEVRNEAQKELEEEPEIAFSTLLFYWPFAESELEATQVETVEDRVQCTAEWPRAPTQQSEATTQMDEAERRKRRPGAFRRADGCSTRRGTGRTPRAEAKVPETLSENRSEGEGPTLVVLPHEDIEPTLKTYTLETLDLGQGGQGPELPTLALEPRCDVLDTDAESFPSTLPDESRSPCRSPDESRSGQARSPAPGSTREAHSPPSLFGAWDSSKIFAHLNCDHASGPQWERILNRHSKAVTDPDTRGLGWCPAGTVAGTLHTAQTVVDGVDLGICPDRRLDGAVEARHRQKVDQLQAALFQSEEERRRVERELQSLRQEEQTRNEENPRPLHVLLSAGEKAPPLVKELKLEVKGTRELRDKIYTLEAELESCKRRLEVDARQQIEKEQSRVRQLNLELEDKERHVSELIFDLKRARSAAGEGDWAQREEEYMRLNLQLRRLEEELTASRRNEQQSAERLLDAEHQILELRFDREQGQHRSSRLETRILELELAEQEPRRAEGPPAAMASKLQSRKERNLENVIEGLERVIHQQKGDLQRLRVELERRPERKGEMEKLRRRVQELEARQQEVPRAGLVDELRQALNTKEERLNALEQQLQGTPAQVPPRAPDASSTAEVQRLQQELAELRRARGEDAAALDEAQRALHEAERTEQRYLEVVRENRRLQQELSALDDEGFWEEIQQLQRRNEQAASLARESKEALEHLAPAAGALDFTGLIARLDVFSRPAA
ncbi:unnamed protein product [Durusdinium trenchii]|uniref:Centrosomal protein of 162 kDa n=1 Tax=Durusdinium trenchii TaxID=1381693 RepID=A0ABP0MWH2_9DINO